MTVALFALMTNRADGLFIALLIDRTDDLHTALFTGLIDGFD